MNEIILSAILTFCGESQYVNKYWGGRLYPTAECAAYIEKQSPTTLAQVACLLGVWEKTLDNMKRLPLEKDFGHAKVLRNQQNLANTCKETP